MLAKKEAHLFYEKTYNTFLYIFKENRFMKTFKVFYQGHKTQRLIREETLIKYVGAEKIEDVRKFLQNEDITIEFIETLSPDHLEYERDNNADFKVTKVNE